MAPMNHSQVLPSRSSRGLSELNEEQRVLNRSKRGWVWNQMFVLEEFSGPEPILVGRVSQYFFNPLMRLITHIHSFKFFPQTSLVILCPVNVLTCYKSTRKGTDP
ncbi:CDH8: Cadherin 8 [Crotalus adamanteus]|uniref:CDH8: Cadherin 8 n=1 Tax=Crotalus adamanteus TaxID=8729 RepID=A0AAW1ATK6_CROAD